MWPGVPVTACASIRPLASNTPAARSPDSRTMVLKAVRCSVWACSSTTAIRRLHMICLSIRLDGAALSMLIFRERLGSRRVGWLSVQAIDFMRGLRRDQTISQVCLDTVAVTLPGIADAATAGRLDHNPLTGGDEMTALARQLGAGFQADIAGGAVQAFIKTARREFHPLEGTIEEERLVDAVFHFDVLTEAAAHAAGAAGVLAIFLAPDDDGRHRFEDLDRATAHPAWKSCRRQAVPERQRAHAAGGDDADHELFTEARRT